MDELLQELTDSEPKTVSAMDEKQSALSGFQGWLNRWQLLPFFCLIGLMGWMVAYLLWPQPRAEIVLKPLTANQLLVSIPNLPENGLPAAESEVVEENATSEDASGLHQSAKPKKPRKRHQASRKKPVHPPVLNLNSASLSQLQLLPGIGPKMAQRIVDYRKAHGAFSNPEQVMDVKGIGSKKFEKLKAYLKV